MGWLPYRVLLRSLRLKQVTWIKRRRADAAALLGKRNGATQVVTNSFTIGIGHLIGGFY